MHGAQDTEFKDGIKQIGQDVFVKAETVIADIEKDRFCVLPRVLLASRKTSLVQIP